MKDLNNNEVTVAESREPGGMQDKSNMPCMLEKSPESLQGPDIKREDEQQVTAALAIGSKAKLSLSCEQFDQWAHDKKAYKYN